MEFEGILSKMGSTLINGEVNYVLQHQDNKIFVNDILGKEVKLSFSGNIFCINCGRKINKTFQQGYCYPCFISLPETEECVLRPELCRAHDGFARDMDFATKHCLSAHYVYLSVTGEMKVGVTRESQIPTRWIDQGASYAIILAKTPNRFLAGTIEVALKNLFSDRTNWRTMLCGNPIRIDLAYEKGQAESVLPFDLQEYICSDDTIVTIAYPVLKYPLKVTSIDPAKTNHYIGTLTGIKGQYLMFEDGKVINLRKYTGYECGIEVVN